MAERILLLSVPHSARLSSIRPSAFTLCSYIEGLTGSGATATVKTRSPCATARLRVGVRPAKRVIMGRLRLDQAPLRPAYGGRSSLRDYGRTGSPPAGS